MYVPAGRSQRPSGIAALGALSAGVAVMLAAYATHAVTGPEQFRLQTAALFAFGHGVALAALAPSAQRRLGRAAMLALLLGMLLFSGSLAGSVLWHGPTTLAPAGGMLAIAGWFALALHLLRR